MSHNSSGNGHFCISFFTEKKNKNDDDVISDGVYTTNLMSGEYDS